MKKQIFYIATFMVLFFSCKKTETATETAITNTITGSIASNKTLKAIDTNYIDGIVYVTNGATLTIEAGATIKFKKGKTALVITRGAKIVAVGTESKPIVFTSAEATPARGDWGGIVILGKATTNATFNGKAGEGQIEGGINTAEGLGLYGGTDDSDNSGTLSYVRIEYPGYAFEPNNEINGLTFGAVGKGTVIDHVQVSYANDDAFEWFGGTVNCKYLIAYKALDDDFDTDNGFSGNVQFGLVVRDPQVADVSKSNGFESDNDASSTSTAPFTSAVFSNISILGPSLPSVTSINTLYASAAHIRRNSKQSIFNSILIGYPTGILIDGSTTKVNAESSSIAFENNYIVNCTNAVKGTGTGGYTDAEALAWVSNANRNNTISATFPTSLSGLNSSTSFAPSTSITGAKFTNAKLSSGFDKVEYIGAIKDATDTWYKNWTKF